MDTVHETKRPRGAGHDLSKVRVRNALKPRREPHWGAAISAGRHIGLRRIDALRSSWVARYRPEGGIQTYQALGLLGPDFGYDEAMAEAVAWFKEKDRGGAPSEIKTVADACRAYVRALREDTDEPRPETARDAERRFARTVYDNPLGKVTLAALDTAALDKWRAALTLGKASKNRTLTAVKAALYRAIKTEKQYGHLIPELRAIAPFKKPGKRRDLYLDLAQRRKLLKAASGAVRDLIEAAITTGCRAGELTSATCSQFDARVHTLHVDGKTGGRDITLSAAAVVLFKRLAKRKAPSDLLLTRDDGKPWKHSDWDELIRDAAKAAKLPEGVCLYTCRHSWISAALASGMTVLEVSKLCGTSLQMIQEHYGHIASKETRRRLDMVAML